jgi:radical SAM superfamily enzyme YgiQ (UPF0313 family)
MRVVLAAVPWSGMVNAYPPLGLGYLASVLLEDRALQASVRIMDFGLLPHLSARETADRIAQHGAPDIVGLSCLTNNFTASVEVAGLLKQRHPEIRIVLGGAHPSVDPQAAAACPGVDAVVYGEGEITFLELVRRAARSEWADGLEGTACRCGDAIVVHPPRALIEDLDTLPTPARSLMELEKYGLRTDDGEPVYTLITSRGCPYACTYCYKGVFGKKYRTRSAAGVLEEIGELVTDHGARHLYFGDDIFMLDATRVREICEGLLGHDLSWSCLARVDSVTPELLALMKRAGCSKIHYGIESAVPEILERIRKKIDLAAVERAVLWTREAGIRSKGYFMAGLPGDTEETLARTLGFARRLPLDEVMFSLATPFPGTALWKEHVERCGCADDLDHAFYFDDGAGSVKAFFNLSEVETEKLEAFVRKAQHYFRNRKDRGAFRRRYGPLLGPVAHWTYRLVRNP